MALTAIILAGGLGTRLRATVPNLPKPMAPVRGRPFLEHLIDHWIDQGVDRFVLAVGYLHAQIKEHFGVNYRGRPLAYSIEERLLGTGGGLIQAVTTAGARESPVLVINGDTYFPLQLAPFLDFHRSRDSRWTFGLRKVPSSPRYHTIEMDPEGRIRSIHPKGSAPSGEVLINAGVYLIDPPLLREFQRPASSSVSTPISLEDELFPFFLAANYEIYGVIGNKPFLDIGVPEDYYAAEQILPET